MENKYIVTIIFITILLIGFLIYHEKLFNIQTFITPIYTSQIPTRYCPECGKLGNFQCSRCSNCGFCITERGSGECVPGDSVGPYFRQDCAVWNYGQPQINTIFVQPVQQSWWSIPRYFRRFDRSDRKRRDRRLSRR
jgi:hypothetical protein